MNIYQVKKILRNNIGKKVKLKYNLGRNKYESYEVIIDKLYSNVFIVKLYKKDKEEIKCFSYNDVVMKQLKIDFKE